ncbi:MAG: class I SAM-dependent methyltransferase [Candidatus Omnitrophica bacterium]|nr:class I SAM-dependent methyltransferase [Candidatus Omnitrophota bacterium]MCX6726974.1 class I SAM-dependent methyltransferase [Candidatus Shapirobacteria bacterium]
MNIFTRAQRKLWRMLGLGEFLHLQNSVIELNNIGELCKVFGWRLSPVLDDTKIHEFSYVEDVNERRIRDAETLATVVRNTDPSVCLEIGTADGHSTALMSLNASAQARIYTINIPLEEILAGKGGELTTIALEREKIGAYYRQRNLTNITQILANTAYWKPDIGLIDVAFIDGCHDTKFVYNDTLKVLKNMKPGSFVLWHDFNLDLVRKYHWINSVCLGVEKLFTDGHIRGRVFHVRDSWIGVYRIEERI